MKTRVVVWAVVGILVVAGIIFLVATSRKAPHVRMDLDSVKAQAVRALDKLGRLEKEVAQAKAAMPPGSDPARQFADADSLLAKTRAGLEQVEGLEGMNEAYEQLRKTKELMRTARRAVKLAVKPKRSARG